MSATADAIRARIKARREAALAAAEASKPKKTKKEATVAAKEPAGQLQGEAGTSVQGEPDPADSAEASEQRTVPAQEEVSAQDFVGQGTVTEIE